MEGINNEASNEGSIDGVNPKLEKLQNKINDLRNSPHSLKLTLALVAALGAFSSGEVRASEDIDALKAAKDQFVKIVQEIEGDSAGAEWKGFFKYIDLEGEDPELTDDFPDFPRSGSGSFEMNSVSIISQKDEGLFEGIAQYYSIDTTDSESIKPTGGSHTFTVNLQDDTDSDKQIIDAISEELSSIYGPDTDSEVSRRRYTSINSGPDDTQVESAMNQGFRSHLEVPLSAWTVTDVVDDEGTITGYTVELKLGEIVEVEEGGVSKQN